MATGHEPIKDREGPVANLSESVTNTDWATVAREAIHADPLKFVIIALLALLMFFGWILAKFIDAKFVSRQVTKVVTAAGGVQASNACNIESNTQMVKDLEMKLNTHAASVAQESKGTREEMAKLRRELNDTLETELEKVKIVIGKIVNNTKTVVEAVEKYGNDVDNLKRNFDFIKSNIKKRDEGKRNGS